MVTTNPLPLPGSNSPNNPLPPQQVEQPENKAPKKIARADRALATRVTAELVLERLVLEVQLAEPSLELVTVGGPPGLERRHALHHFLPEAGAVGGAGMAAAARGGGPVRPGHAERPVVGVSAAVRSGTAVRTSARLNLNLTATKYDSRIPV